MRDMINLLIDKHELEHRLNSYFIVTSKKLMTYLKGLT